MAVGGDSSDSLSVGRERIFLTPRLAEACRYLTGLQLPDGGWPRYQDGSISVYHTSIVVSALADADYDKFARQIADAALHARREFAGNLANLDMSEMAHFLRILRAEREPDRSIMDRISAELKERADGQLKKPTRLSIREFSVAVTALSHAHGTNTTFLKECGQQLLEFEKLEGGGWPGAPGGRSSLIATAEVLEALRAIDSNEFQDPIQRGARFLDTEVADGGWNRIGTSPDVFAQATVLRVLAECQFQSSNIDAGIAALEATANKEGGWGSGPSQPSTIEATATAIRALAAGGENRFVPYRSASITVARAARRAETLEEELSKMKQELEDQVSRQSNKILEDRNALRRENERLGSELARLQGENQIAQRTALEEARRSSALISILARQESTLPDPTERVVDLLQQLLPAIVALVGLSLFLFNSAIIRLFGNRSILLVAALFLGFASMSALLNRYLMFRRKRALTFQLREVDSTSARPQSIISRVVLDYAEISIRLPAAVREELAYMLASRVVEMPPDIGVNYARSFAEHVGLPRELQDRLLGWVMTFVELDSFSRRAVVEQIRRQTLIS